jgi:hypothetical protein
VSSESSRQALVVEEEVTREGSSSSFEIKFCPLAGFNMVLTIFSALNP